MPLAIGRGGFLNEERGNGVNSDEWNEVRAKGEQPPLEIGPPTKPNMPGDLEAYRHAASGLIHVNGAFTAIVGGYGPAGLILHIGATVMTLGIWLPVLITYLAGWRKRTVTLHIQQGVVVRVDS